MIINYFTYMVVAVFLPIIIVDYPPPDVYRRRFIVAVVAGILGGLFTGAVQGSAAPSDLLATYVLAAASGTLLYGLGNMFFGASR